MWSVCNVYSIAAWASERKYILRLSRRVRAHLRYSHYSKCEFSKTTLEPPPPQITYIQHALHVVAHTQSVAYEMLGGTQHSHDAFCYTIHMIIVSRIFLANFLIKSKFMFALSMAYMRSLSCTRKITKPRIPVPHI